MPNRIHIGTVTAHAPRVFPMPGSTLGAAITVRVNPCEGGVFVEEGMLFYEFVGMATKDGQPIAGTEPVTVRSKPMDEHDFGMVVRDELRGRLEGYRTYSFVLDGFLRTVRCDECEAADPGDDRALHTEVFTFKEETPPPMFDDAWEYARKHASAAHRDRFSDGLDYARVMRAFVSELRPVSGYVVV